MPSRLKRVLPVCLALLGLAGSRLQAETLSVQGLPSPLELQNKALSAASPRAGCLDLRAPGGSNLFLSPDGGFVADNAPMLLMRPQGPFILSARIRPEFGKRWDAGCLVVYCDAHHYAKFCFERDYQGTARIVSVVCNEVCDDCNSSAVAEDAVWYRIAGSAEAKVFNLYASKDGSSWYLIRSFRLRKTDGLRLGFSAQSPDGPGCLVHFTDIRLESRPLKDFWAGD